MTPKQKADNLIDKFLDYAWADIDTKGKEYSESLRANAKQCALVHVDEILKLQLVQPLMTYGMNYVSVQDFYTQVKLEIENL